MGEKELQRMNEKKQDPDHYVVLHSEETGESFMLYESHQGKSIKKKGVLTNSFTIAAAPKNHHALNVIKIAYRTYFNANDRFNHYLNTRFWPYKRNSWQSNYDDFFFAVAQMNAYSYWHESQGILNEDKFQHWSEFTLNLSKSLFRTLVK